MIVCPMGLLILSISTIGLVRIVVFDVDEGRLGGGSGDVEVEGRAVVHDALVRGVEVDFRLRARAVTSMAPDLEIERRSCR